MGLGAKFKFLNALTFTIHFTIFRFARVFYNFYSFTIQARSQFSTLPRKKSWLAWASQHALILGKNFNNTFQWQHFDNIGSNLNVLTITLPL